MNITTTKLTDIKSNPNNPRIIKDDKFKKSNSTIFYKIIKKDYK